MTKEKFLLTITMLPLILGIGLALYLIFSQYNFILGTLLIILTVFLQLKFIIPASNKYVARKWAVDLFPKLLYKMIWIEMGHPKLSTLNDLKPISEEELILQAVYNEFLGVDNANFGEGLHKQEFQKVYANNKERVMELAKMIIEKNKDIHDMIWLTSIIKDESYLNLPYSDTSTTLSVLDGGLTQPDILSINAHRELGILNKGSNSVSLFSDYCSFMEKMVSKYKSNE